MRQPRVSAHHVRRLPTGPAGPAGDARGSFHDPLRSQSASPPSPLLPTRRPGGEAYERTWCASKPLVSWMPTRAVLPPSRALSTGLRAFPRARDPPRQARDLLSLIFKQMISTELECLENPRLPSHRYSRQGITRLCLHPPMCRASRSPEGNRSRALKKCSDRSQSGSRPSQERRHREGKAGKTRTDQAGGLKAA